MKDKDQLSALLGVCIVPQVIAEFGGFYGGDDETNQKIDCYAASGSQ